MKILIIKLSSLGDIIHTFPAVTDLRKQYPDAQIDWLIDQDFRDVLEVYPSLSGIYSLPLRTFKSRRSWSNLKQIYKEIIKLRQQKYDYIIDTQGLLKSSFIIPFLRGTSYGYSRQTIREKAAAFFYNKKIFIDKDTISIEKTRLLLSKVFSYSLDQLPFEFGLNQALCTHEKYVLFLHGTSRALKSWPPQNWQKLGLYFVSKGIPIFLPWTTKEEFDNATLISQIDKNIFVLPKMPLRDIIHLVKNSYFTIGVDTGLMHLSAAFNIPTIGLYNQRNKLTQVCGNKSLSVFSPIKCAIGCNKNYCSRANSSKVSLCMQSLQPQEIIKLIALDDKKIPNSDG